jgi:hypothetical protein
MGEQIQIPITKAGKNVFFNIDSDDVNNLPADVFAAVIKEGLKVFCNSRMSTLPAPSKLTGAEAEEAKAAALAKAEANWADMKEGKLVKRGAGAATKSAGVPRAEMTEALRLAKEVAKDLIRKAGMKISHVPAKDITAAAKQMVENDPSYFEKARQNLAERATIPTVMDIKSLVSESPKLKAEAEARNAAKKEKVLSAKQSGLVAKVTKTAKVPPRRPTEVQAN